MENNLDMDCDKTLSNISEFNYALSIYIPVINELVTEDKLKNYFIKKNIGVVSKIDFVYNVKGIRQAFIHFSLWFLNDYTKILQENIINNKKVCLIKNKEICSEIFNNENIILLPNLNPKTSSNIDVINKLHDRVSSLENMISQMISKSSLESQELPSRKRQK